MSTSIKSGKISWADVVKSQTPCFRNTHYDCWDCGFERPECVCADDLSARYAEFGWTARGKSNGEEMFGFDGDYDAYNACIVVMDQRREGIMETYLIELMRRVWSTVSTTEEQMIFRVRHGLIPLRNDMFAIVKLWNRLSSSSDDLLIICGASHIARQQLLGAMAPLHRRFLELTDQKCSHCCNNTSYIESLYCVNCGLCACDNCYMGDHSNEPNCPYCSASLNFV